MSTAFRRAVTVSQARGSGGGPVTDSNAANNSATDTDGLAASADLAITKTDGVTTATAGGSVTYTITASNAGPSGASGATVADTFPASLTCTWTCVGAGGGTCTASGSGNINDAVNLPAGGSVTYTASCTVSASASETLINTATVVAPAGVTDPTPANNSATDTDLIAGFDYFTVNPCRLLDTRTTVPIAAGDTTTFTVWGLCGVPTSARAVELNVTVVAPAADGDLQVYRADLPAPAPVFSSMSFHAGVTRANNTVVLLDGSGQLKIHNASSGTVHILLDVSGYFAVSN
jgi:uncharacterized repeat protein (TIGR01451 family)